MPFDFTKFIDPPPPHVPTNRTSIARGFGIRKYIIACRYCCGWFELRVGPYFISTELPQQCSSSLNPNRMHKEVQNERTTYVSRGNGNTYVCTAHSEGTNKLSRITRGNNSNPIKTMVFGRYRENGGNKNIRKKRLNNITRIDELNISVRKSHDIYRANTHYLINVIVVHLLCVYLLTIITITHIKQKLNIHIFDQEYYVSIIYVFRSF